MTIDTTRLRPGQLTQLLGSRLCHDLVSPLGAIGNGVELLEMSPDYPALAKSAELRLISESVQAARNRIQGFRVAFGQSAGGQRIGRPELVKLLEGFSSQTRLNVTLDATGDFARPEIRMVLLALMCLETAMPWGGRVLAVHSPGQWRLVAEADRTRPEPELWTWLGPVPDETEPLTPRPPLASEVQFPLLADAAAEQQRQIHWELDDKGAEIAF
ncbi:histidine phosphotransferase [Paracoccus caeni]|uniref:Histidine phosphotransferase n=1 Tax=Paracoccus caeni TaxID=657651 RepID=A0A934SCZ3_9RHOB|nr:histidine phosphotransferase family protein [Paracoccus caeni]MBK4215065.1 histidine phosphotransferase [Paracoccus caeni]